MKKILLLILSIVLSFVTMNPVHADEVQDKVVVLDSQTSGTVTLCSSDTVSCSNYRYLHVELRNPNNNLTSVFQLSVSNSGSSAGFVIRPYYFSDAVYTINPDSNYWLSNINLSDGVQYTLTLTNSLSGEDTSGTVNCDDPFIVRLFGNSFWEVATSLTVLIVPIIALFLVFRLVHDLLWGRG